MKYIVGYPIKSDPLFVEEIIKYKDRISEVYFSWGDLPNGRSALSQASELTSYELQQRQVRDLTRFSNEGIRLNLLLNATCYGAQSQSRAFFQELGNLIDYIKRNFGLSSVTTASVLIARFVKENFHGVDARASVNMEIGTVEGFSYVMHDFQSFYIQREKNRDLSALSKLRQWCDANDRQIYLLANSGCLNHCSVHMFHDNLVSHENEISKMDNGYQFKGVCWDFLSNRAHLWKWLERTNFIRPEDIGGYEGIVPAVKLATRVNASPSRVLRAYVEGNYRGGVPELLEPNHSGAFYPFYIDNALIPSNFAARVGNCDKDCARCGYCAQVMKDACVNLKDDFSVKR